MALSLHHGKNMQKTREKCLQTFLSAPGAAWQVDYDTILSYAGLTA
jgi:hypothetical protein